jgi:general stress protein CsbA
VPRPRPAQTPPPPAEASSAPHLAGLHELGDSAAQPDWWRVDSSPFGVGDSVPGFVGGVEIPELLKPPPRKDEAEKEPEQESPAGQPAPAAGTATETAGKPGKPWWRPRGGGAPKAGGVVVDAPAVVPGRRRLLLPLGTGSWSNPFLLLAAGLLVAGAVLGNWIALVLGWAIAYASRRLSDAETKWAVVILPGLSLTAGVVWLWGRTEGRWGTPVAEGHMNDALAETWPWVVRGAAVASALFLVWRSQRRR